MSVLTCREGNPEGHDEIPRPRKPRCLIPLSTIWGSRAADREGSARRLRYALSEHSSQAKGKHRMSDAGSDREHHPGFAPPAPTAPDKKQKRNSLIQIGVGLVIVFVVFVFVLPSVISYEQVWEAIKGLSAAQMVALLAAGLFLYIPEGWLYKILVPGLSLWRGIKAWVASTAVGTTIPTVDLVTRFGMYRSWGNSTESSMLGILLSGVFDNIVKFSLPVIGVILLGIFGVGDLDVLIIFSIIAAFVLIVTIGTAIGVVRSEAFTIRLANWVQGVVNWGLEKFKKDPLGDLSDRVVGFRDAAVDLVRAVWWKALIASALGKLWAFVMLVMSLRFVGIGADVLPIMDIFIVWTIVLLIQAIPITPGGIGIVGVAYIFFFTQILGQEWSNAIAAGVAVFRILQWALPIPIGWAITFRWRAKVSRGDLPDPFQVGGDATGETVA
jgi:uncharacterized protein (TIRG00374 family)